MPAVKTTHGMRHKVDTCAARKSLFQKLVHLLCTLFNRARALIWRQPGFSLPQKQDLPLDTNNHNLDAHFISQDFQHARPVVQFE